MAEKPQEDLSFQASLEQFGAMSAQIGSIVAAYYTRLIAESIAQEVAIFLTGKYQDELWALIRESMTKAKS